MKRPVFRKLLPALWILLGIWLGTKYLLPLLFPFLLGAALAVPAEPGVRFLNEDLHLPRGAAAALGVTATLLLLLTGCTFLLAFLFREAGMLCGILPDAVAAARQGLSLLEDWLISRASLLPEDLSVILRDMVMRLFSGGSHVLDRVCTYLLGFAGGFLSRLPGGALSAGTGILAAYMISARMPRLRRLLPDPETSPIPPFWQDLKNTLGAYLRAQAILTGITFVILTLGLMLLSVATAPMWAFLIALVDAIPVLGTGTVLIPWSLVCLLQQNGGRALGLLVLYAAAALTRTVLEPRLLGRRLGIDPLITLAALYIGFRLWGFPGLILSPLLAVILCRCMGFFQS